MVIDSYDANSDGYLLHPELYKLLSNRELKNMPENQVNLMVIYSRFPKFNYLFKITFLKLKLLDKNSDGRVDFDEFLDMATGKIFNLKNEVMAKRFFKIFDADYSGYITENDLKQVIEVIATSLSEDEIKKCIKMADTDNDGRINYKGIFKFSRIKYFLY